MTTKKSYKIKNYCEISDEDGLRMQITDNEDNALFINININEENSFCMNKQSIPGFIEILQKFVLK
jgi:hypothetical protein